MKKGYQLYSARAAMKKDFAGTLRRVREIGYEEVEFAGFFGKTAEETRDLLDELGLRAVCTHTSLDDLLADPDGQIAFHKKIGAAYVAVPWLDEDRRPGGRYFARTIRALRELGEKLADNGIGLLYHNHDFEFTPVSGQPGLDFLLDAVDARWLNAELDTCWINIAGCDVVSYIEKYRGRCPILHLKDFEGAPENKERLLDLVGTADGTRRRKEFAFRPFGHGEQDADAVMGAALRCHIPHVVVEQDDSGELDPLDAAEMSLHTVEKYLCDI